MGTSGVNWSRERVCKPDRSDLNIIYLAHSGLTVMNMPFSML
jgi:hypothetical protein